MKDCLVFLLKNHQTLSLLMYIRSDLRGKISEEINIKPRVLVLIMLVSDSPCVKWSHILWIDKMLIR